MAAEHFCVVEYLYRDADNFKAWGALLLKGVLSNEQVAEMKYKFESEVFFIAEQVGVPPLYQELWAYSDGTTESDHPWHEFFIVRPADENDLAMGAPWGTASALFQAITEVTRWNERLSPHYEIGYSQFPMFGNGETRLVTAASWKRHERDNSAVVKIPKCEFEVLDANALASL